MAIERSRSRRKVTGGRYIANRKSRQHAKVNKPILTGIGQHKVKEVRRTGGTIKQKLLQTNKISVAVPKEKRVVLAEIEKVNRNLADKNLETRNIINKGAIVQTNLGPVKITSRPGQNGAVAGVLIE